MMAAAAETVRTASQVLLSTLPTAVNGIDHIFTSPAS
jgi:hypothetical protein